MAMDNGNINIEFEPVMMDENTEVKRPYIPAPRESCLCESNVPSMPHPNILRQLQQKLSPKLSSRGSPVMIQIVFHSTMD